MALEAVVAQQDLYGYNTRDLYNLLEGNWSCEFGVAEKQEEYDSLDILENQTENFDHANWNSPPPSFMVPLPYLEQWGPNSSSEPDITSSIAPEEFQHLDTSTTMSTRPKRRRSKSKKNKEEIENQRMTHIAVERNRRKLMNEYLSALRGLMPDSYVQRGDQASIIGGAINYVKELEQRLQFLGGHKHMNLKFEDGSSSSSSSSSSPFAEFFTFPQYSTSLDCCDNSIMVSEPGCAENQSAIADIEVTMVESHANLKIRSKRRPKQLLKMVSGFQYLRLTILHLNVTTVGQIVLYSLSVKVEDDCNLTSVDEIATAVNQMLGRIQQEAVLF